MNIEKKIEETKIEFAKEYPTNALVCCCGNEYCDPETTWDSERLSAIWAFFEKQITQLLQESNEEAVREFVERYLERVRTQTFVHKDMPNFMKQYLKEIKE